MSTESVLDSIEWSYEMSYYHLTNLYYHKQKLSKVSDLVLSK